MPWNNQTGGRPGNGGRGPWGGGPSGSQPPDLEDLLKRSQERLRRAMPGGFGRGSVLIAALLVVGVWLATGIYFVQPDQQGVVLRFGAVAYQTSSGPHYHLPWPIETVETPSVTRENAISVGFIPAADGSNQIRQVPEESLMLTGDENIVDINFTVFWVIRDAADYLFNVENPGNPNAAIKEATGEVGRVAPLREGCGDDFALLSGDDSTAAAFMLAGGDGCISVTANVAPRKMRELCEAARHARRNDALRVDAELAPLHEALFLESNPIPVKWAMAQMALAGPGIRLPLVPLAARYHDAVWTAMLAAGVDLGPRR